MSKVSNLTPEQKIDVSNMLAEETSKINLLLTGVVVVLFIGFITLLFSLAALLISSWQQRPPSYQELINDIQAQNSKIDFLYQTAHTVKR